MQPETPEPHLNPVRVGVTAGDSGAQPTIFVSIPAYRDPECQYTIVDLFHKARFPGRVYVGVCWQVDEEADGRCFLLDLRQFKSKIRELRIPHTEARGPCYARARIERELFGGEDYLLQLDSHYRMIPGWDEELLTQLALCSSPKPVLTTYPSSYTLPDDYVPGEPDRAKLSAKTHPVLLVAREISRADGFLRISGKAVHAVSSPQQSYFWAAGLSFALASVIREVPYDATLEDLFFGEESSMAVRLWTSGWDFFSPSKLIGYHLWTRKHRPNFRQLRSEEQLKREALSQACVRAQLGMRQQDDTAYPGTAGFGLGSARTLADYEAFCGVYFAERMISARALRGGFSGVNFVDGDPAGRTLGAGSVGELSGLLAQATGVRMMESLPDNVALLLAGKLGGTVEEMVTDPDKLQQCALVPESPSHLTFQDWSPKELQILLPSEVEEFNCSGFVVINNFLVRSNAALGDAADLAPSVARRGALHFGGLSEAKLGSGENMWSSDKIRGDEIAWLRLPDTDELPHLRKEVNDVLLAGKPIRGCLNALLVQMASLRSDLDGPLGLRSVKASVMLARYPGQGARYARHTDALPQHLRESGKPCRRLTAVYYLNSVWEADDGGCLRVHMRASEKINAGDVDQKKWVDVEPQRDRLVLFCSETLEHEVLPAYAERFAVTMWLY